MERTEPSPAGWDQVIPRLRGGVRLCFCEVRDQQALLHPEGVALLNPTAGAILALADGTTSVASITSALSHRFIGVRVGDVGDFLGRLEEARLMELTHAGLGVAAAAGQRCAAEQVGTGTSARTANGTLLAVGERRLQEPGLPLGLLAELTHRCPLHCPYCSNPLELTAAGEELTTATWQRVFGQARRLGVLQAHLSGGEPLVRRDLEALAAEARSLGMYVNLVTSGMGLTGRRAHALAGAGVEHVQLSLQGATARAADRLAGAKAHDRKLEAAAAVRAAGMVLTINVVLHRGNATSIAALAELAANLGADRLELAHTQYYGWALRNRQSLLPTAGQVRQADAMVHTARARHPELAIIYVGCDYYDKTPKPCMNGWGSRQLTITPGGTVLPCPAATVIPGLDPPSIHDAPLASIWAKSVAFTQFRGTSWLPEPCHSCPARETDFGGCRCQAYQLLGDAGATDPVCHYSPRHQVISAAIAAAAATPPQPLVYRTAATSGPESALAKRASTDAAPAIRKGRYISLPPSGPANCQQAEGTRAET
jgi:PqqA peptide cyclase